MKWLARVLVSLLFTTNAIAQDIGSGSISVPTGRGAVQTDPPDKAPVKTVEATRLPRRDTKSALVCSAADGAPKLRDRMAEGSCRSHTKEHQAEAQKSTIPLTSPTDINAISGR